MDVSIQRLMPTTLPAGPGRAKPEPPAYARLRFAARCACASAVVTLALASGCGGKTAPAGSPTKSPDAPEWVHRGSRVQSGSIFGVGFASGIKNTELARTTAANRGRSEISKILEVYSASLMKDYQASTSAGGAASAEEQHVEQAVKTFSANLMNGTEVKEYWLDPAQGVWFALVELNFERARDVAAAQAKMNPGLKDYVDQNGGKVLGDMEGDEPRPAAGGDEGDGEPAAEADEPPPPPPAERPAQSAPPPSKGPEAVVGGPAPGWTKGECDQNKYLCGVGHGGDHRAADIDARAELARIFQANIQSVSSSFESASRKISSATGETWAETQMVSQHSLVSTDKVVTMSEIMFRWDDGKGAKWSLAVIDRAQAGAALRDRIEAKDSIVRSQVARAQDSDDKLTRLKALKAAVGALAEREALNADLRVIDKSGRGIPPPHDIGEITGMLDSAHEALSIGVAVSGTGSDRVQACLEEAMTAKGYQVEANATEDEDEDPDVEGSFDVLIKGVVKAEKRGQIAGSEVVNTTLTIKVINGKTSKVIKTLTASKKASRGDVKQAVSTSVHQLCTQKVKEIVESIDRAFSK